MRPAFEVALQGLGGLLVGLVALIVARQVLHEAAARRRLRLERTLRPLLFDALEGDGAAPDLPRRGAARRLLQGAAVGLLGKVRGEDHEAVVALLVAMGAVAEAERGLRSRRPVVRGRAAELLGAAGWHAAGPGLVALLQDRDAEVRAVAARSLGKLGDPAAVAPLLGALDGPRRLPAGVVAMALVRLGDPASAELRDGLRSPSPLVRSVATQVLGESGDLAAVDHLLAVLVIDPSAEIRGRAARALGHLGLPRTVAPLITCLETAAEGPVRAEAARALGLVGSPLAAGPLAVGMLDPDPDVARQAAHALQAVDPGRVAALAAGGPSAPYAREARALATLADDLVAA